jgi:hypothetical protein
MKRAVTWVAAVTAAVAAMGVSVDSALAARAYDSSISPIPVPWSVAFDASGNAWIPASGTNSVYVQDPYPSQNRLRTVDTSKEFESQVVQLAIDKSTGNFYLAQSNGRALGVYDENGNHLETWTAINGHRFAYPPGLHVAVDNSSGYSRGRVYLSLTSPENVVEALDTERRPVQFPATAPYINGNALTGTPAGPFGEVEHLTVDELGNIYATDTQKNVVDEFSSTGEFLRSFSAPLANFENPDRGGVGVDPTNGDVLITEGGIFGPPEFIGVSEYDANGNLLGRIKEATPGDILDPRGTPAVDAQGRLYVPRSGSVAIFKPAPVRPEITYSEVSSSTATGGTLNAEIDPRTGGAVTACRFEFETTEQHAADENPYELATKKACAPDPGSAPPASNFTSPTDVSAELSALASEKTYYYRVVVESPSGTTYGADRTYTPHKVVGLRTDDPDGVTASGAQLHGSLVGDGTPTTYRFEWGRTSSYGNASAVTPAGSPSGPSRTTLPALDLTGLEPFTTYHYRVVATGGAGTSNGEDRSFTTLPGSPTITREWVAEVQSDRAIINAEVDPNGAKTTGHLEYVDDATFQQSGFQDATRITVGEIGFGMGNVPVPTSASLSSLVPGTVYHYRVVASNFAGAANPIADHTFRTYSSLPAENCPNAHERQQTGAALLLDCRAYELASARNAGGYPVESDLVLGQTPFGGYPTSGTPRLLYGTHDGGIPGTGNPTNHGVDPYVATRTAAGWTTSYVGIPADNPFATAPFASTLGEADDGLDTFVFAGPDICSPCFSDESSGAPVHLPDGGIVQGMAGSLNPGPGAVPAGYVGRALSADGTHFVFGSTSKFEPDGNGNGDVSIYSRNLINKTTNVVSKTPLGQTMTGPGIAELDVSADGSRVLIGRLVSTDAAGNRYWHLYMNVGGAEQSIDLMPGSTSGGIYAGMTGDGTAVYFSTPDQFGGDTDSSSDIYRADVSDASATLARVSTGTGGTGDTDGCDPAANPGHAHWNSVGAGATCDVLAIGGGGGVAKGGSTIYFLSPEALDTSNPGRQPVPNAPNLYVAQGTAAPRFVATLESALSAPATANPLVVDSLDESEAFHSGEFQLNRSGKAAVFTSTLQLTNYENVGRSEVIRYDAASGRIDCASCNPTGEPAVGDGTLAPNGRSLTDDGRVFFNSTEGLVDRDLNEVKDAYEWTPAQGVELISTGTEPLSSSLLGVSADGIDAYFFTRGTLVPEDENGSRVKIYDARSGGGFAFAPPRIPCKASDECHGPSSQAGPAPAVRTVAGTPIGNLATAKPKCKRHKNKKCRRRHGKGHHHKPGKGAKKNSHGGGRSG